MRAILNLARQCSFNFSSKNINNEGVRYTKSHEWIEYLPGEKKARVGITHYAQDQLGEIVHVELPSIGKNLNAADSAVVVESVKVAADVYTPISGQVLAINELVSKDPALINSQAEKSWLFEISATAEPQGFLTSE